MNPKWFCERKVLIATKHGKEQVLAPLLRQLELSPFVAEGFDTDQFGTFTGEIERKRSPQDTLRTKLTAALDHYSYTLGVASEGSFGPHPQLSFIPANEEWVLLIDRENNLELWGHELTSETNYQAKEVTEANEVKAFANEVGFPEHGIIVRGLKTDAVAKEITTLSNLISYTEWLLAHEPVRLETDMRAMRNPTRMKSIERAGQKLVEAACSLCPHCQIPGFVIRDVRTGLPCECCGTETRGVLAFIRSCVKCGYHQEELFPRGEKYPAQYCDYCNP